MRVEYLAASKAVRRAEMKDDSKVVAMVDA